MLTPRQLKERRAESSDLVKNKFPHSFFIDFLYLPSKSFPTQYLLREQERRQKIVESWKPVSCEL